MPWQGFERAVFQNSRSQWNACTLDRSMEITSDKEIWLHCKYDFPDEDSLHVRSISVDQKCLQHKMCTNVVCFMLLTSRTLFKATEEFTSTMSVEPFTL